MKRALNIGLVGVGGMGKVHHANYQMLPDCRVAAVVGTSPRARAAAAEWGVPCFDTIAAMTAGCDIDVVDVCTPTYTHHDLVLEALRCGRHVICEKPIALSAADARVMLTTPEGTVLAEAEVNLGGQDWTQSEANMKVEADCAAAVLRIGFPAGSSYAIDMVSLFPEATFHAQNRRSDPRLARFLLRILFPHLA